MARKNIVPYKVATAQSLAAGFTTIPTVIAYLDNCSYQINVNTTNSTGIFEVQASLDYRPQEPGESTPNPGNWSTLPLTGVPSVSTVSDTIILDLNQLPFSAIRLSYTPTVAGTGTADIYLLSKQLGG